MFKFPNDLDLQNKWLVFLKREKTFIPSNSNRIMILFKNNLQSFTCNFHILVSSKRKCHRRENSFSSKSMYIFVAHNQGDPTLNLMISGHWIFFIVYHIDGVGKNEPICNFVSHHKMEVKYSVQTYFLQINLEKNFIT